MELHLKSEKNMREWLEANSDTARWPQGTAHPMRKPIDLGYDRFGGKPKDARLAVALADMHEDVEDLAAGRSGFRRYLRQYGPESVRGDVGDRVAAILNRRAGFEGLLQRVQEGEASIPKAVDAYFSAFDNPSQKVGNCSNCVVLGQQVRTLVEALAGLGSEVFNWSAGLDTVRRRQLTVLIMHYATPCVEIAASIEFLCFQLKHQLAEGLDASNISGVESLEHKHDEESTADQTARTDLPESSRKPREPVLRMPSKQLTESQDTPKKSAISLAKQSGEKKAFEKQKLPEKPERSKHERGKPGKQSETNLASSQAAGQPFTMPQAHDNRNAKDLLFITADAEVETLGMKCYPPPRVIVESLVAGGWAASQGMVVGCEVAEINGMKPEEMDNMTFISALESRPLQLIVQVPVRDEEITSGTFLHCTLPPDEDPAEVFASMHSRTVIEEIPPGGRVIANGPPEAIGGTLMVPVKPSGVVELDLFEVCPDCHKIRAGSILLCILSSDDDPADVFESMSSHRVVDQVGPDATVIADGPPELHDDHIMVPVRPRGAVELDLFKLQPSKEEHEEQAVLADQTKKPDYTKETHQNVAIDSASMNSSNKEKILSKQQAEDFWYKKATPAEKHESHLQSRAPPPRMMQEYHMMKVTVVRAAIKQQTRQILAMRLCVGVQLEDQPNTLFHTEEKTGSLNPVWRYEKYFIANRRNDVLQLFLQEADEEIAATSIKLSHFAHGVHCPCNLECCVPGVTVDLTIRIDWLERWEGPPPQHSAQTESFQTGLYEAGRRPR